MTAIACRGNYSREKRSEHYCSVSELLFIYRREDNLLIFPEDELIFPGEKEKKRYVHTEKCTLRSSKCYLFQTFQNKLITY